MTGIAIFPGGFVSFCMHVLDKHVCQVYVSVYTYEHKYHILCMCICAYIRNMPIGACLPIETAETGRAEETEWGDQGLGMFPECQFVNTM